jgi:hypothetical protein
VRVYILINQLCLVSFISLIKSEGCRQICNLFSPEISTKAPFFTPFRHGFFLAVGVLHGGNVRGSNRASCAEANVRKGVQIS